MTTSAERLPDFFIVGHPKSGTTALYEMLRAHPQIFMPDLKEPRYFATDLRPRFQPAVEARGPRLVLPETLEDYVGLFKPAGAGQIIGEASPSYLRSAVAAGSIAAVQPGARIIAILREPASFIRSLHLELVQNHVEQEQDLRRALEDEDRGSSSGEEASAALPRYSDRVRYVEQLRRYHAVFPPEQVLVLIYDDFRHDNEAMVRKVLRFLGVDDELPIEPIEANPTVHVRSIGLDRMLRRVNAAQGPLARRLKDAAKASLPVGRQGDTFGAIRRRLLYGAPRPQDEQLMGELRRRFRPEVQELSSYLDRDLIGLWGYDDLQ